MPAAGDQRGDFNSAHVDLSEVVINVVGCKRYAKGVKRASISRAARA